jgi:hypothetical protein
MNFVIEPIIWEESGETEKLKNLWYCANMLLGFVETEAQIVTVQFWCLEVELEVV